MHILHLIYTLEVGGAETMLVDIINGQIARGHQVTLLIVNQGINQDLLAKLDPKVRVVAMNRRQGAAPLLMMARLNLKILQLHPDIIHAHHHKFGRLVRLWRKHLLLTVHEMNQAMTYCSTTQMVAITDVVEANVRARVPRARVTTIHNGIRTADVAVRGDHAPGTAFKIVQVGRLLAETKGQDVLIRALADLRERGIGGVEVSFIGTGPDEEALAALARELGVAGQVHFLGLRDRDYIYAHLADYDAMVHPSRSEGFGLTVAEAMAAGLPLAVTKGDGPWEVADHGRLCESFPAGDYRVCAEAILRLRNNYGELAERTAQARQYVKRFDIAQTVDSYLEYYRSIL